MQKKVKEKVRGISFGIVLMIVFLTLTFSGTSEPDNFRELESQPVSSPPAPATGEAIYTDVDVEDISSDQQGKITSKTTIEGMEIKETGSGGEAPLTKPKTVSSSFGATGATPGATPYIITPSGSLEGATSFSKIVVNIVTLRFLVDWGILPGPIDAAEGFTRLLLLILLFALLFRLLSGFNLVGKGTAIAIALVISLMTVIFIPSSVLLAVAASYGTLFSLLLMLMPVGLALAGYWFLKEYPWLRVAVMLLLWWILGEMEKYILAWSGSAVTGSQVVGYGVVIVSTANFISYVKWLVFAVLLINLFQALFKSSTGHSGRYSNNLKTIFKSLAETGYKNLKNKAPRAAKNLLREYVEEERELELLRKVEEKVKEFEKIKVQINSANSIENENEKKSIMLALGELKNALEAAEREMKSLNRKTWRAESRFGHLLKTLQEKNYDTSGLMGLENNILKKHKECAGHLTTALKELEKKDYQDHVRKYHGAVIKSSDYPFALGGASASGAAGTLTAALSQFQATVAIVQGLLAQSITAETEAKTDLEGVIAKAEDMLV